MIDVLNKVDFPDEVWIDGELVATLPPDVADELRALLESDCNCSWRTEITCPACRMIEEQLKAGGPYDTSLWARSGDKVREIVSRLGRRVAAA
jgi:hypothetical protein